MKSAVKARPRLDNKSLLNHYDLPSRKPDLFPPVRYIVRQETWMQKRAINSDAAESESPHRRKSERSLYKHSSESSSSATTFIPALRSIHNVDQPTKTPQGSNSFLRQKAQSVMARRAEAASMSSMTASERAAFDDIWKMFEPGTSQSVESLPISVDQKDTDYEKLLDLFATIPQAGRHENRSVIGSEQDIDTTRGIISHTNQEIGTADHTSSTISNETGSLVLQPPDSVDTVSHNIAKDVSNSFEEVLQATTENPEFAMWQVCEEKIFPLIKLLAPSRASLSTGAESFAKAKSPTQQTIDHPLIPPATPLIPLLSKVYPATLLLALRLFQRHHPTSHYCLGLLPHIKSLGPTSYVLGANTHFYNTLLSIRWDIYSDLDEMTRLLSEMDRMGLKYNIGTSEVLQRVRDGRVQDLNDENNRSVQHGVSSTISGGSTSSNQKGDTQSSLNRRGSSWWERPLIDQAWTRLSEWTYIVERRLDQQSLDQIIQEGKDVDVDADADTDVDIDIDVAGRFAFQPEYQNAYSGTGPGTANINTTR